MNSFWLLLFIDNRDFHRSNYEHANIICFNDTSLTWVAALLFIINTSFEIGKIYIALQKIYSLIYNNEFPRFFLTFLRYAKIELCQTVKLTSWVIS